MNRRAAYLIIIIAVTAITGATRAQDEPEPPPSGETAPVASDVASDIRRVVHALESKNGWVSLDALDYVSYFGTAAVPILIEELGAKSANGRVLAAVALGEIPDPRAIPALIERLDDKGGLELNVLDDDGEKIHAVYPSPEHNVAQQARVALERITGCGFAKAADWRTAFEHGELKAVARREPEWQPSPPEARWLRGLKICIDPGHGGDRAKLGYKRGLTYLSEADLNLRVARYVRDLLERAGATVVMTRDGDVDIDLKKRDEIAARAKVDLFLSIHHNWAARLDTVSTTTWYHMTPDEKPASIDLARFVEESVAKSIDLAPPPSGGLMSDNLIYKSGFGVLRGLPRDIAGCLCETTYYSNFAMERRLRDPDFNRKEAWGFFAGIARYLAAGIPRADVVSTDGKKVVLQVKDGLEERGDWAKAFKIFAEHTIVRVDGARVAHDYDGATGRITVGGIAPGAHELEVVLININKNHSWPKRIAFTMK